MVDTQEDANLLQSDINTVTGWSNSWQLKFNEAKCKTVHYGKKNQLFDYVMPSEDGDVTVKSVNTEKDLGLLCDRFLSFSAHTADVVKRANTKLGMIKRSFSALNDKGWLRLYT